VNSYKRLENSLVRKIKDGAWFLARGAGWFFKSLYGLFARQYTIALVPHSEKKIYNLHVTLFSVCLVVILITSLIGTGFWYVTTHNEYETALANKDSRLKDTQANLDQLRDEVSELWREAKNFQTTLSGVFSSLGVKTQADSAVAQASGDISSFFDVRETAEGRLREADDIRNLAQYLASAQEPLKEMGTLLNSQSSLLTEVPNIWPIKGGLGHISMFFGENENPFTGQNYVHKGIDLSTYRAGDPIVATADGQVVTVDYDAAGFGNYVIIRHKHGFYTRYGHMMSFKVKTGQRVEQGEVIGYIGNTGLSTGPHVHYEVHVGSDVVDPYKFLNIRNSAGNLNGGKS
jgi:murein DD-endopeptidase MepM/ murein hydrolase activator NlpD